MSKSVEPGAFGRMVRSMREKHELRERCKQLQDDNERLWESNAELLDENTKLVGLLYRIRNLMMAGEREDIIADVLADAIVGYQEPGEPKANPS